MFIIALVLGGFVLYRYRRLNTPLPQSQTIAPKSTDGMIATALQQLEKHPDDIRIPISLSQLYLQKVRETADAAYYKKIDELMSAAEKIDPRNSDIASVRALNAMGRHDFAGGLIFAKKALTARPDSATYWGIVGDAEIELGQYQEAAVSFQRMIDLKPNFSSWSRVAYIRELNGDIAGAKDALNSAITAGSYFPENTAWGFVELGKLAARDSIDDGEQYFNRALKILPNYPPALEGLAGVAFAKGDYTQARRYLETAFDHLPIAQYAIKLGDIAAKEGDTAKANQQYTLARIAFDKSLSSGVNTDMEMALFLADHDMDLPLALAKAEAAYKVRPSILGADTLAWALYKNQKYTEAARLSHEALRLGWYDPIILFHAAMIAEKNNNRAESLRLIKKSLALNPHFSFQYVDVAHEIVKKLER